MRQWLRAALKDEWDGIGRISRDVRPADVATMANALVGLAAIVVAPTDAVLAAHLILLGILLDGVDGALARAFGGGPLGGFLDSLADLITFGAAPAVLLAAGWGWLGAAVMLLAVMMRLARFEALRERRPMRYFSGLSSPGGALVVAAAVLATDAFAFPAWAPVVAGLVAGPLMVSRVRYPKLRGWLGIVGGGLIFAVVGIAAIGYMSDLNGALALAPVHGWALALMAAFMAFYLLAGPFYVLARIGPGGT